MRGRRYLATGILTYELLHLSVVVPVTAVAIEGPMDSTFLSKLTQLFSWLSFEAFVVASLSLKDMINLL